MKFHELHVLSVRSFEAKFGVKVHRVLEHIQIYICITNSLLCEMKLYTFNGCILKMVTCVLIITRILALVQLFMQVI